MGYIIAIPVIVIFVYLLLKRRKKIIYIASDAKLKEGIRLKIVKAVPLIDKKGQGMRYLLVDEIVQIKGTIINPILYHEWYLVNVHGELGTMNPRALYGQEVLNGN